MSVKKNQSVQKQHGGELSDEEFRKFTLYCNQSNNYDIEIGENVLIGPHANIVGSNHLYNPDDDFFSSRTDDVAGKVVIEDGVWLTGGVTITPGCRIGKCALICANSVITSDIPAYAIAAGTPAKVIGSIDPQSGEYRWFHRENKNA